MVTVEEKIFLDAYKKASQNEDKRHFWRLSFSVFKNSLSHHLIFHSKIEFRTK